MYHRNCQGYRIPIYDTDREKKVDAWIDDYYQDQDMNTMMTAIENVRRTNKRSHDDEFIEMVYEPWRKNRGYW